MNKPRTIVDKLKICRCDIVPKLGKRSIYDVTERDLLTLVKNKGRTAKVRANRLASELKVLEVGLEENPARRLADLIPSLRANGDLVQKKLDGIFAPLRKRKNATSDAGSSCSCWLLFAYTNGSSF